MLSEGFDEGQVHGWEGCLPATRRWGRKAARREEEEEEEEPLAAAAERGVLVHGPGDISGYASGRPLHRHLRVAPVDPSH
ncbi:hypothetical protein CLOM_g1843 [Closterium sp. NIES-68]|nr:hypothetical protein CLOM_g1843 [Closterium sp. NIES-68]